MANCSWPYISWPVSLLEELIRAAYLWTPSTAKVMSFRLPFHCWNMSATICPWTVCHVTALTLIVFYYFVQGHLIICHVSIFRRFAHTACVQTHTHTHTHTHTNIYIDIHYIFIYTYIINYLPRAFIIDLPPFINQIKTTLKILIKQKSNHFIVQCFL